MFLFADGGGAEIGVVTGLSEGGAGLVLIDAVAFLIGTLHAVLAFEFVGQRVGDDICGGIVDVDGESLNLFFAECRDGLFNFLC